LHENRVGRYHQGMVKGVSKITVESADMPDRSKASRESLLVAAVSGGPDSVYLLHKKLASAKGTRVVVGHVNYGTRGKDSEKDQRLVENLGRSHGMDTKVLKMDRGESPGRAHGSRGNFPAGFEREARDVRYRFLKNLTAGSREGRVAMAHTADDQVETILMRFLEGAGIAGLKGIPRETTEGIYRPILDVWKEDILRYLKTHKIPYRVDTSNLDTRFERNWIRHVLIPLLEKRYGKAVKKRIFSLGERFRELDDYLEIEARHWIRRNVKSVQPGGGREKRGAKVPAKNENSTGGGPCSITLKRVSFAALPSVLRIRIFQKIGFEKLGLAPNERLLVAMDRAVRSGNPSARLNIGKGWELVNGYDQAVFAPAEDRKAPAIGDPVLTVEEKGSVTPAQARRASASGGKEYFDAAEILLPVSVRPLRAGDRFRPFGRIADKKVKEILIDRKVPREERWGRPAVCDAEGKILWIPGILRSAHAPVTDGTKRTVLLNLLPKSPPSRK